VHITAIYDGIINAQVMTFLMAILFFIKMILTYST